MHLANKIRFGLLLVLVLVTALLFASCGKASEGSTAKEEGLYVPDGFSLAEYTIVRGDSSGNAVLKAALNLRSSIRQKSGATLALDTDFSDQSAQLEILVGPTNRPESLQVYKELTEAERYIIRGIGTKIVIAANTRNNLYEAVDQLVLQYLSGKIKDPSTLNIVCKNEGLILYSNDVAFEVVVSDDASDAFVACAQKMLDTLHLSGVKLVRYSQYSGGTAALVGKIKDDIISTSYAVSLLENEYIARTAAGNVYLLGNNDLLSLTALGDFLVDMEKATDHDFAGNCHIVAPHAYSFNYTWEFSVPKPMQAVLENAESITGNSYLFYYCNVSEYSLALFEQMLIFVGFAPEPYTDNTYRMQSTILNFNFAASDQTLSVMIMEE